MIAFLIKMADSMMQKVVLGLFYWMMIVYATVLGLIGVAWTTIWHPTTAFKSKKRNGERRFIGRSLPRSVRYIDEVGERPRGTLRHVSSLGKRLASHGPKWHYINPRSDLPRYAVLQE